MGRASRRKIAHIGSRKTGASTACPGCSAHLDGLTEVQFRDSPFERTMRLKGYVTMCCYCGAVLIFADDAGNVRMMTKAERNSLQLAPEAERLYAEWRQSHPAGDFTRKRFN
jgi:hypothetical protein